MALVIASIALYLVATAILAIALQRDPAAPSDLWRFPATIALAMHACVHVVAWNEVHGPDLHFFAALSLVSLGMATMTTAVAVRERVAALAVLALPLAAAMLAAYRAYGHAASMALDWQQQLHAALALLAYATLAVAALLAVTLWAQERALRRREFHGWLRALPPLVQLESLLFRTIAVGFGLLTATLLTGVLFVENLFAQHLVHKKVLGIMSWLAFGALLIGRRRYGWRGATAVRWTLAAMALLVLAYFGSKAVLELILHRPLA
jgi:ABC-type uncharacterized transport system permease subunit